MTNPLLTPEPLTYHAEAPRNRKLLLAIAQCALLVGLMGLVMVCAALVDATGSSRRNRAWLVQIIWITSEFLESAKFAILISGGLALLKYRALVWRLLWALLLAQLVQSLVQVLGTSYWLRIAMRDYRDQVKVWEILSPLASELAVALVSMVLILLLQQHTVRAGVNAALGAVDERTH